MTYILVAMVAVAAGPQAVRTPEAGARLALGTVEGKKNVVADCHPAANELPDGWQVIRAAADARRDYSCREATSDGKCTVYVTAYENALVARSAIIRQIELFNNAKRADLDYGDVTFEFESEDSVVRLMLHGFVVTRISLSGKMCDLEAFCEVYDKKLKAAVGEVH